MTPTEIKNIDKAVKAFKEAYDSISKLWSEAEDFDANIILGSDYPFKLSFNEIDAAEWPGS